MGILNFIDPLQQEIAMVYGQAGTGKTTLALQTAVSLAREHKKTLFLDTEGGFSVERLKQMCGDEWASLLDYIVVMRITSFSEQYDRISQMIHSVQNFGLVIVDTIGHWYRQEVRKDATSANRVMDRQLRLLFEMSRHVPVLLMTQVYADVTNKKTATVGGAMVLKWCKKLIELQKEPRTIILHKPMEKKSLFDITNSGLVFS